MSEFNHHVIKSNTLVPPQTIFSSGPGIFPAGGVVNNSPLGVIHTLPTLGSKANQPNPRLSFFAQPCTPSFLSLSSATGFQPVQENSLSSSFESYVPVCPSWTPVDSGGSYVENDGRNSGTSVALLQHPQPAVTVEGRSCIQDTLTHLVGNQGKNLVLSSTMMYQGSHALPESVTVPFGWKRLTCDGKVVYVSPSECHLTSLSDVVMYLQTEGTCKCGLECPVVPSKVFNFNPAVQSKAWALTDSCWNDASKLCIHKRKTVAMATFQNSTSLNPSSSPLKLSSQSVHSCSSVTAIKKKDSSSCKKKKMRTKNKSPFDGVLVSELLAQRDKMGLRKESKNNNLILSSVAVEKNHCSLSSYSNSPVSSQAGNLLPTLLPSEDRSNFQRFCTPQELLLVDAPVHNNSMRVCPNNSQYPQSKTSNELFVCTTATSCSTAPSTFSSISHLGPCGVHLNMSNVQSFSQRTESGDKRHTSLETSRVGQVSISLPLGHHMQSGQPLLPIQQNLQTPATKSSEILHGPSPQSVVRGNVLHSQLQVNQCIGLGGQLNSCMMLPGVCPSYPRAPVMQQHGSVHEELNSCLSNNEVSTPATQKLAPNFFCRSATDQSGSSQVVDGTFSPNGRQKLKKSSKVNNTVRLFDRGSPCPNVDVRQIPPEHHRPPTGTLASQTVSKRSASTPVVGVSSEYLATSQGGQSLTCPQGIPVRWCSSSSSQNEIVDAVVSSLPTHNLNDQVTQSSIPETGSGILSSNLNNMFDVSNTDWTSNCSKLTVSVDTELPLQKRNMFPIMDSQTSSVNTSRLLNKNLESFPVNAINRVQNSSEVTAEEGFDVNSLPKVGLQNSVSCFGPSTEIANCNGSYPGMLVPNINNNHFSTNLHAAVNLQTPSSIQASPSVVKIHVAPQTNQISPVQVIQQVGMIGSQQVRPSVIQTQSVSSDGTENTANGSTPSVENMTSSTFVQFPGPNGAVRSPLWQHNASSGILVQNVFSQLSQRVYTEYTPNTVLPTASRTQFAQHLNGMVLPTGFPGMSNSQQILMTPDGIRVPVGGPAVNSIPTPVGEAQPFGPTQQLSQPLLISDGLRPNLLQSQQLVQNGCFIIGSSQPSFTVRNPHLSSHNIPLGVGEGPSQCANISLTVQNDNSGTLISSQPYTRVGAIPLAASANQKNTNTMQSFERSLPVTQQPTVIYDRHELSSSAHLEDNGCSQISATVSNGGCVSSVKPVTATNAVATVSRGVLISANTVADNNSLPGTASYNRPSASACNSAVNQPLKNINGVPVPGQLRLNNSMPPLSVPNVTTVTTSMTQVIPAVGMVPQVLSQPAQPVMQVFNLLSLPAMQNTVLIPPGQNFLPGPLRIEQPSPVIGTPTHPTNITSILGGSTSALATTPLPLSSPTSFVTLSAQQDESRGRSELYSKSVSRPSSTCSTPLSSNGSISCVQSDDSPNFFHTPNRKKSKEGKKKPGSQTVASMLQSGTQNSSVLFPSITITPQQQTQQAPVLQTFTVLPPSSVQQSRQLMQQQQQVISYNGMNPVIQQQMLSSGFGNQVNLLQPFGMIGLPSGGGASVMQNIPLQQYVSGPSFHSIAFVQNPQNISSFPQEPSVLVQGPSNFGIQSNPVQCAFPDGSFVSNVIQPSSHVSGADVILSPNIQDNSSAGGIPRAIIHHQGSTPVVSHNMISASVSTPSSSLPCNTLIPTTATSHLNYISSSLNSQTSLGGGFTAHSSSAEENLPELSLCVVNKSSDLEESSRARSVGVQSGEMEHNAAVQTVTSVDSVCIPVNEPTPSTEAITVAPKQNIDIGSASLQEYNETEEESMFQPCEEEASETLWPDPVNLSAAVRAVMQEGRNNVRDSPVPDYPGESFSKEETSLSTDVHSRLPDEDIEHVGSVQNCESTDFQQQTVSEVNLALDLSRTWTYSNPFVKENNHSLLENQKASKSSLVKHGLEEPNDSIKNLQTKWGTCSLETLPIDQPDNAGENASSASSDTSEQSLSGADNHSISDSGVESSQEPMNLVCGRDEREDENRICLESRDGALQSSANSKILEGTTNSLVTVTRTVVNQNFETESCKTERWSGVKRRRREVFPISQEDGDQDSDEENPDSPPLPPQPRTFNIGDLVWGHIRGFPSWPGKLVQKEEVRGSNIQHEEGKVWVKWFGDHTFTQVEPEKLKTLSEGLEAHHRARKKYRRGRKMNSNLENAIQEAMLELDRPTSASGGGSASSVHQNMTVPCSKTGRSRGPKHRRTK